MTRLRRLFPEPETTAGLLEETLAVLARAFPEDASLPDLQLAAVFTARNRIRRAVRVLHELEEDLAAAQEAPR